jgi:hypothetical protein
MPHIPRKNVLREILSTILGATKNIVDKKNENKTSSTSRILQVLI